MLDEPEMKKKVLRLVSRKSTRKVLSKWKKLENPDKSDNDSFADSFDETTPNVQRVLGLPLRDAVDADPSMDGIRVPAFFRHCIDYIEEHGLLAEGIYRLSPPKTRLDELERRANCCEPLTFADAHDAVGLIKRFLRQLPEPLLPIEFERIADACECQVCQTASVCRCGAAKAMRIALAQLDVERRSLATIFFLHAQHVIQNKVGNKMGIAALGLLLQTVLEMSRKLVCFCLIMMRPLDGQPAKDVTYVLGEDARIEKYVPPMAASDVETWQTERRDDVKRELRKQNCLLEQLHRKISIRHQRGSSTRQLDEQLWQVQGAITFLKRRLKQLPESPPVASVAPVDSRCAEIYEEKQLMATQGMLREDMVEEQRRIAQLCWNLRVLGLPRPRVFGCPKLRAAGVVVDNSATTTKLTTTPSTGNDDEGWEERCKLEEAARGALLGELVRLRNECAQLRARLEMSALGLLGATSATPLS